MEGGELREYEKEENKLFMKELNDGYVPAELRKKYNKKIGVALEDAAANEDLNVVIRGFVKDANVATGGAIGDRIVGSSTAGRATQYAASSSQAILGYQLAAASGNKADVFVIKQF